MFLFAGVNARTTSGSKDPARNTCIIKTNLRGTPHFGGVPVHRGTGRADCDDVAAADAPHLRHGRDRGVLRGNEEHGLVAAVQDAHTAHRRTHFVGDAADGRLEFLLVVVLLGRRICRFWPRRIGRFWPGACLSRAHSLHWIEAATKQKKKGLGKSGGGAVTETHRVGAGSRSISDFVCFLFSLYVVPNWSSVPPGPISESIFMLFLCCQKHYCWDFSSPSAPPYPHGCP